MDRELKKIKPFIPQMQNIWQSSCGI
jgi:hypothetical protein